MKTLLAAVLAVVAFSPAVGYAQTATEPLACMPSCRKGFVCVNATCVSACNPACAADEICTDAAECVPKTEGIQTSIPAGDDPKELRKASAFAIYGAAGYQRFHSAVHRDDGDWNVEGFSLGAGIAWRRHFTRVLGLQARGSLVALGHQGDGGGWGGAIDFTLRIGPVANAFPWYFGVGPSLDLFRLKRTIYDSSESTWNSNVGGVFETGFIFGERDSLDLGLRGLFGTDLSDAGHWTAGGQLVAGFRFR